MIQTMFPPELDRAVERFIGYRLPAATRLPILTGIDFADYVAPGIAEDASAS